MRVGLVVYGSLDTVSGGYLYDRELVAHLRRQKDDVEVYSLSWRSYGHHLTDNVSNSLFRRLAAARLDILLQDELNHPSLFWHNRRLQATVSYPIISVVHHLRSDEGRPFWQNWFYRRIERQYLASVDGFVTNSEATRTAVEALVGPDKPVVVARPGGDRWRIRLDGTGIRARANEPGPLRVVFLGNLIPRKGLHTLLAALARMPAGTVTLDVIGSPAADPAYSARMQALAGELHLEAGVAFRGLLADAQVAEHLTGSHALVVPSRHEGFGIVYLEGMGFGLPAIATTAGGAGEIVRDGENGFLVAPGNVEALATCLTRLHADRALLATMAVAARRTYDRQPTWEETGEKIRAFLEKACQDANA